MLSESSPHFLRHHEAHENRIDGRRASHATHSGERTFFRLGTCSLTPSITRSGVNTPSPTGVVVQAQGSDSFIQSVDRVMSRML